MNATTTLYHQQDGVTLYEADAEAGIEELPKDSVDCLVTSPPYWRATSGATNTGTSSRNARLKTFPNPNRKVSPTTTPIVTVTNRATVREPVLMTNSGRRPELEARLDHQRADENFGTVI